MLTEEPFKPENEEGKMKKRGEDRQNPKAGGGEAFEE